MDRYKVLWIDDDPSEEFIGEAKDHHQIDIDVKTCHNDGIAALKNPDNFYHAIILDANCKITNDEQEKPSLESLNESILEVHTYCTSKSVVIPWFVYTGGGYEGFDNLASRISSKREWDDRKYYNKPKDRYVLFDNLKKAVDQVNSIEWQLWNKHRTVFDIFSDGYLSTKIGNQVMELLKTSPPTNKVEIKAILTNIRSIHESCFLQLESIGVIPDSQATLNNIVRHLSGNIMKTRTVYAPTTKQYQNDSIENLHKWLYFTCGKYIHNLKDDNYNGYMISNYAVESLKAGILEILLWFKKTYEENK